MFPTMKRYLAALYVAALVLLLNADPVQAQSPRRQTRLAALQQLNAMQQQQNAVQTAVQQTSLLLQSASQRSSAPPQTPGGVAQSGGAPNLLNFQQQQSALQAALQQTTALLQVSFGQNSALSQSALRQLNTLQNALQQSMTIQGALAQQSGQLTPLQLQTLSQQQSSLMGLLTSPPAPLPKKTSRR